MICHNKRHFIDLYIRINSEIFQFTYKRNITKMLIEGVDDLMHFCVLLSIIVRVAVSRFPYSGAGKPPMYGDYEAQRHWMEITVNLPPNDWYKNSSQNDLMYWGLDYPPLTAYHSFLCGRVAKWINPNWVALNTSRGFEGYYHKIFMRSTVLVSDLIFYIPLILYWSIVQRPWNLRNKAIAAGLCLLYPGLILIDHGHFQYNSVSLGLVLWAIVFLMRGQDLAGAAVFTMALHYKQMSLYYAIPFFCYLLGCCLKLKGLFRVAKFLNLSCVVIIMSSMCWLPFLRSFEDTLAVMERIFPFSRGLYEDKVANIWYMLSIIIKWKSIFSTASLVKISTLSTILAVLPSSIHLVRNPSLHKFRLSLVNVSLAFFMFSFQVHEKTILFPALPVLLLLEDHPLACVWFGYISTFSLVPLLAKDGLMIPFMALSALFIIGAIRAYEDLILSFKKNAKISSLAFGISILGSLILIIAMYKVKQPDRYPHLHVLLNSVYCGIHFVGFLLYFNYLQYKESPYNLYSKKIKYN